MPIIVIGIGTVIPLKSIIYSLFENISEIGQDVFDSLEEKAYDNMIFALKDIDKQMLYLVKLLSFSLNNLLCNISFSKRCRI